MRFTVHDVEHGSCISLVTNDGRAMLWDCGYSENNRPSIFLENMHVREISCLTITNFDQDHIGDLPALREKFKIKRFSRNKSISNAQLRKLKKEAGSYITQAMENIFDMNDNYIYPATTPIFENIKLNSFSNRYGSTSGEFQDTNNISLVSFLTIGNTKIIIPGDLEKKGWLQLLHNENFRNELKDVNIFIASHHGRENGYCHEVFDYCVPDVFVFSDKCIEHGTQEGMALLYGQHVKGNGVLFRNQYRKVLTTRNDGTFYWDL